MLYCNKLFRTVLLLAVMMSAVPHAYGMDGRGRSQGQKPTCQDCQRSLKLREKAKRRAIELEAALGRDEIQFIRDRATLLFRCEEKQAECDELQKCFNQLHHDYKVMSVQYANKQIELRAALDMMEQEAVSLSQTIQQLQRNIKTLEEQKPLGLEGQNPLGGPTVEDYDRVMHEKNELSEKIAAKEEEIRRLNYNSRNVKKSIVASPFMGYFIYKCAQYLWNKCSMGNHPKVTKTRDMVD